MVSLVVGRKFTPDFDTTASDPSGLAYALYRFNSTSFSGDESLRLGWLAPPDDGTAWIGLGRIAGDRWEWHPMPHGGKLSLTGGLAPYSAANGDVLVLVVVTGTSNDCNLSYVRLGNEPPYAVLQTTNGAGPLPLQASFDATVSSDADGDIASYEIDFGEGAGFKPMPGGTISHTYSDLGIFSAVLRVTDDEGATTSTSSEIDAGVAANQPPVAHLTVSAATGIPGDSIDLDASTSSDPDGSIVNWEFDPEGDGSYLHNGTPGGSSSNTHLYTHPGTYHPTVRITDNKGATATASKTVTISYGTLDAGKVLDAAGGDWPSIAVANGKLCVSYIEGNHVAFVRATTVSASTWFAPQLLGSGGLGQDLAIIGGHPALVANNNGNGIEFYRATDTDGVSWGSGIVIGTQGSLFYGVYPALATINGKPAVEFSDATGLGAGNCYYQRATNVTGTAWGSRVQISAANQIGVAPNLLVLNSGLPCSAISRGDGTQFDAMQFALANNANGTIWNSPLIVNSGNDLGGFSKALRLVGGRPALAYYDGTAKKIYYVRAKDASGLEWNTPVLVAAAQQLGGELSLAVINGLPAIAFSSNTGGIQLCSATGTLGGGWNTPVSLDPVPSGSYAVSLTAFNALPAVAYTGSSKLYLAHFN